jgi:hypothetical protein
LKGSKEFWKGVKQSKPQVLKEIVYYAYYDWKTKCITSARSGPEDEEWPEGRKIKISKELYRDTSKLYRCKVFLGKLIMAVGNDRSKLRLEPCESGTFISLTNNIIFRAEKGDKYKLKEYNVEISSPK